MRLRPFLQPILTLLLLQYGETLALAGGIRFDEQGASAAAQSQAFSAQADDPSAIHYNAAGITQLPGIQISGGINLVGGHTSFRSPMGNTASGDLGGSIAWPPPSNAYLTANLADIGLRKLSGLTAGIGLTSPFGLRIRYPVDGPFSTAVTSATLSLIDIKPTIAYKVSDWISIGAGADVYTITDQSQKFNWPGGGGIPVGSPAEINGGGSAAGFNIGVLYTPLRDLEGKPLLNVGIVYRSQAAIPVHGQFLVNGAVVSNTSTKAVIPEIVTAAIAVWPTRSSNFEWKVEFDFDYEGWHKFQKLNVSLSDGNTLPFPQNWHDSFNESIGTEIKWIRPSPFPNSELALRAGYCHSGSAVPAATFTPAITDANQHLVSVGGGFLCKAEGSLLGFIPCSVAGAKAIGLDLAFTAVLYEQRTIAGNINPTVDGVYQTQLYIGALNFRANF